MHASVIQNIETILNRLSEDPEHLRSNWCVPPEEGKTLGLLTCIHQARRILEVGTSIGYSTLWFAWGLAKQTLHKGETVQITTLDASAKRLEQAQNNFNTAQIAHWITPVHGDACSSLEDLNQNTTTHRHPYDLMFLDARKSEYQEYLLYAERLLRPGGLLLADNTQSHRSELSDFIQSIESSPQWDTVELPFSNGLILARKVTSTSDQTV